ncbi:DUF1571 domain-containing protein [Hymenobacter sp. BRD67]|uniref:LysM peptidoglycan-binding domain-containing protein n=1 Tax=Hymenobacter sp. BRD67 TaxID=2675877 RepID=UPI001567858D|nr:DUF1571 domain-containing protein [Hymenobacter sp. BRD67]QKG52678.1 DUF1571 domain-containing protein [Hymenobacter sp. BRD67]
MIIRSLFFVGLFICSSAGWALEATPITTQQLTTRLISAILGLKTLRVATELRERVGTSTTHDYTQMKLAFNPYRVYLKNQKGVEVLYVTGQNDNEAWVYPAAFPYITLSLNPTGTLMRKGQHHTVLQAGFSLIANLLGGPNGRGDNTFSESFRYMGDTTAQGESSYILRSDYPDFHYISYRVGKNESIESIATHFSCGEYRIIERNKLSADSKLIEGQVLQIPSAYGRRVLVTVDAKNYLPTSVTVYDDRGLYEKYIFSAIVANQPISSAEFSKGYKGYKL